MSKISKLNELKNEIRVEEIRIADEVVAELRAGTFDHEADEAVQALEIAADHIHCQVFYQQECRSNASSWDNLWTRADNKKVERLYEDLNLVIDALKKAEAAFEAKIPF